jgi:hypothetical protein
MIEFTAIDTAGTTAAAAASEIIKLMGNNSMDIFVSSVLEIAYPVKYEINIKDTNKKSSCCIITILLKYP